jgi:hypothetical protein
MNTANGDAPLLSVIVRSKRIYGVSEKRVA